jgi:hypothetical protein
MKGFSLCGLWGVERQVGLARWTRWLNQIKCGPHGGKKSKTRSVRFLDWATKPRSSRDFVGVMSWVVISGGYIKFVGFAVVHQKTIGLLGWATKPRPKTGCRCQAKIGLTSLENRFVRFGVTGRRKLRGGGHASGSQGLRRGYAKCCRRASVRWCYEDNFPKCHWWVCILV